MSQCDYTDGRVLPIQRTRTLLKKKKYFCAIMKSMRAELFPISPSAEKQRLNYSMCTIGGTITSQITLRVFSRADCVRGCVKMAMSSDPVVMETVSNRGWSYFGRKN